MPRLFFALPLPAHVRSEICSLVSPCLPETLVRPVPAANLHITMAFLGQVDDEALARATALARAFTTPGTEADTLTISGAGAFPGPAKPRVIWLGIGDGGTILGEIHTSLCRELEKAALPYDPKPLRPHLTVAYARKNRIRAGTEDANTLKQALATLRREAESWTWSFPLPAVRLYESRLLKTGAVYREL